MTEAVLAGVALVVGCIIALLRDETELVKIWSQLVSPHAERFRATLDAQVKAKEFVLASRRDAAKAARTKDKVEAARLAALADEAKQEYRTLRELQRMLSALR